MTLLFVYLLRAHILNIKTRTYTTILGVRIRIMLATFLRDVTATFLSVTDTYARHENRSWCHKIFGPWPHFTGILGPPSCILGPLWHLQVYRPAKCNKTKSTTVDVLIDFKPGPLRPLVPRTVAARTVKSARKRPSYRVVSTAIVLASSF